MLTSDIIHHDEFLKHSFNMLDSNGNGFITHVALKSMFISEHFFNPKI